MGEEKDFQELFRSNANLTEFFKDKMFIKHQFSIDGDFIDFIFEDEAYCYLVIINYENDILQTIRKINKNAETYAIKKNIKINRIKKCVLVEKHIFEENREKIEIESTKNSTLILSYNNKKLLKSVKLDPELLFKGYIPSIRASLSLLADPENNSLILGRNKLEHTKYGDTGLLHVGRVCEKKEEYIGKEVLIDAIQPHKIFICGKTGSGKSYTMGVIAEELASLNLGIGIVIIDPMGVFWSMKFPCRDNESSDLKLWGLESKGFSNVKVFVPIGSLNKIPENTYDEVFAIKPSELSSEDWCDTFGIDIYQSPQGTLLNEVIGILSRTSETTPEKGFIKNKGDYSIDDMLECINRVAFKSSKKYRSDTIRALAMHLESAKNWGIFSSEATSIHKLSVPNQVSIIDISFLPEYSRSLAVGVIARKILEERTKYVRFAKAEGLGTRENIEEKQTAIPVTWLMVDEAHILVPSKGKTAASEPLVEYAKRGRMPGCALVLATQQPGVTDDRVLSQVDVLITHNLSFYDDIAAYRARVPSNSPIELSDQSFIRRLPVGAAIIADQSPETERAFVMYVRPRISEHAGRIMPPQAFKIDEVKKQLDTRPTVKEHKKEIETPISTPQIPMFSIPRELVTDYLSRLISYQLFSYLEPDQEKRYSAKLIFMQSQLNRDALNTLASLLISNQASIQETKDYDGTPVLLISRGKTRIALTAALTESTTIFVCVATSTQEQELIELREIIDKFNTLNY